MIVMLWLLGLMPNASPPHRAVLTIVDRKPELTIEDA